MCRQPRAALEQDASAGRLQFRGDFRDDGDASFRRPGFREDTDDDGHADLPQNLKVLPNVELWHKSRLSLVCYEADA